MEWADNRQMLFLTDLIKNKLGVEKSELRKYGVIIKDNGKLFKYEFSVKNKIVGGLSKNHSTMLVRKIRDDKVKIKLGDHYDSRNYINR